MSEISSTLNQLIDVAERALICRQRIMPDGFEDFVDAIAAIQAPVGATLSDAPRHLVAVLGSFWRSPDAQRPLWLMTIAALLQLVRDDLGHVIEARKRPLEPDTAYRTGGGMPRDERRSYARR
jgi:hypothetical protein